MNNTDDDYGHFYDLEENPNPKKYDYEPRHPVVLLTKAKSHPSFLSSKKSFYKYERFREKSAHDEDCEEKMYTIAHYVFGVITVGITILSLYEVFSV